MADRLQLYEYKGDRCAYCGLSVKEMLERYGTVNRMFQFHHVDPARKHGDYCNLIRRTISTEQLDELDKCVLLCDEHHGVLEAQGISATVQLTVRMGGRTASQTMKGQMIVDLKDRTATFLSNEKIRVTPYMVAIGDEPPRLLFGTELLADRLIERLFWDLPTTKRLVVVRCSDERPMLLASHLTGRRVAVKMDVTFPVLSAEFCAAQGDKTFIWLRNGVALTRDGEVIDAGLVSAEMTLSQPSKPPKDWPIAPA